MAPVNVGGPVSLVVAAAGLSVFAVLGYMFYNLFLHPLRDYPGPLLWRASPIPRAFWVYRGLLVHKVEQLHRQYGTAVRIMPNEIAYIGPEAWNDIYGHRKNGVLEFDKWKDFYEPEGGKAHNIIYSDRSEHSALRRALSHGFSDRSMRAQEPIIAYYIDLLMKRLNDRAKGDEGTIFNMREWLNWTTFDVIGELGFASSFDCLRDSDYHPWIRTITQNLSNDAMGRILKYLGLHSLVKPFNKLGRVEKERGEHVSLMVAKVSQRMELVTDKPDFLGGLIANKEKLGLSFDELLENANVLLVAGSETTATLLCGCLFLLGTNPDKLAKVVDEVRTTFAKEEEITLNSISQLPYMLAVLNESLRCYPPVGGALPRVVPKGGAYINERFVPEGSIVGVWQWSSNYSEKYWTEPYSFVPERFLGDERFKNDRTDSMQPFSTGPRNCIGRNLAYSEMRLILAKFLWNFDMTLDESSKSWLDNQLEFSLWLKPELNIRLVPVKRSILDESTPNSED